MPTSEARINANRANSLKSCGPRTAEGKEASRRNGLKHGMTGEGIVVPESDVDKIARRAEELRVEMAPRSAMGEVLLVQIATLSVRVERSFTRDHAATSFRVRHAGEAFDDSRYDEAEALLETIGEDPRKVLRKLKRMPEGVEAMIEVWQELRADLTRSPRPRWTQAHRERAENLTGKKIDYAHGSTINAISKTIWGDPGPIIVEDEDPQVEAIKARGRSEMIAFIDDQIGQLEAHYETLDLEAIEADRAEAPARALFDASKEATLARRYESEALRNFHKALKEFRRVEAEAAALPAISKPSPLASSRETPIPAPSGFRPEPIRPASDPGTASDSVARTADGRVLAVGRPPSSPV